MILIFIVYVLKDYRLEVSSDMVVWQYGIFFLYMNNCLSLDLNFIIVCNLLYCDVFI